MVDLAKTLTSVLHLLEFLNLVKVVALTRLDHTRVPAQLDFDLHLMAEFAKVDTLRFIVHYRQQKITHNFKTSMNVHKENVEVMIESALTCWAASAVIQ